MRILVRRGGPGVLGFYVVFSIRANGMMRLVLMVVVKGDGVAVNIRMGRGKIEVANFLRSIGSCPALSSIYYALYNSLHMFTSIKYFWQISNTKLYLILNKEYLNLKKENLYLAYFMSWVMFNVHMNLFFDTLYKILWSMWYHHSHFIIEETGAKRN